MGHQIYKYTWSVVNTPGRRKVCVGNAELFAGTLTANIWSW